MADKNWWDYPVTRGFLWSWTEWIRHSGIDYGAPCGTAIIQPTPGTVIHSGVHPWGGQIDVLVDHLPGYESGPHVMTYLHSSAQYVQEGQRVSAGTVLGLSGQPPPGQGYGAGCHVHFEITHGNVAPYTTYSPSRNPSQSSYPESGAAYVARLRGGKGGGDVPAASCGAAPNASDFGNPTYYAEAYIMYNACLADHDAANQCGDVPQRHNYANDASWEGAAKAWTDCYNSHHAGGIGNPLDPLGTIANFITNIPHNIIRVGKIVFGFGLCAIGLVLAFLPDVGAGLVTAFGAPEFASAIRQGVSGGLGGAARGGIRAASLVPGRQRAATRQRQREERATARARTLEETRLTRAEATRPLHPTEHVQLASLRAQRGSEEERAARTAPLFRAPVTPVTRAQGGSGGRGGQRMLLFRTGPVREGPHSKPLPTTQKGGRFGGLGTAPKREGPEGGLDLLKGLSRAQTENVGVRKTPKGYSAGTQIKMAGRKRAIRKERVQTARALPSVQSQAQRAEQTKRAVGRAIKRRRSGT